FQSPLGNCSALAHLLAQLNRLGSALFSQEPEFIVACATYSDILKVVWNDQDVVPAHEMHHPEKGGARHIAGQALNDARLQVHNHGIAKTLRHECDTLVVREMSARSPKWVRTSILGGKCSRGL